MHGGAKQLRRSPTTGQKFIKFGEDSGDVISTAARLTLSDTLKLACSVCAEEFDLEKGGLGGAIVVGVAMVV
jgi:hypothetical protein